MRTSAGLSYSRIEITKGSRTKCLGRVHESRDEVLASHCNPPRAVYSYRKSMLAMLSPLHAGHRGRSAPSGQRKSHQNRTLHFCFSLARTLLLLYTQILSTQQRQKKLRTRSPILYRWSKGQLRHENTRENSRTIHQLHEFPGILKGEGNEFKILS
ncbi:hypothetical protein AVEN_32133-1 [Araneus ventricosus]|uniref:Uncharacterized protein n=1 Tax=Araneus ventricosus TaxID=182803 RepID=A0A4Y2W4A3_ARAVE|nr:hypothetical protein AVEN_32133-1 [Araneus ventricosus]